MATVNGITTSSPSDNSQWVRMMAWVNNNHARAVTVGVAVIILVIIVGVAIIKNKKSDQSNIRQPLSGLPVAPSPAVAPQEFALSDLVQGATPQRCTFQDNTDKGSTVGTVYAIPGKMRVDFARLVQGNTAQGHIIVSYPTVYAWLDGAKTGGKTTTEEANEQVLLGVDLEKKLVLHCQEWGQDTQVFTLPTGVAF